MARPPFQNPHLYASVQEVQRHDDAVHYFGEMVACVMLWSIYDFNRDLVGRCSVCYVAYGATAEAYKQPAKNKCPSCYGTTFEGGIRALVYRPAIVRADRVSEDLQKRGVQTTETARIQPVSDILMRDGDFVVRSDTTRWKIAQPLTTEISTGFGPHATTTVQSMFPANLQDNSSVAYTIPIDLDYLQTTGWMPYMNYPTDRDTVSGYLIDQNNVADVDIVIDGGHP